MAKFLAGTAVAVAAGAVLFRAARTYFIKPNKGETTPGSEKLVEECDEEDISAEDRAQFDKACQFFQAHVGDADQELILQIYGLYKCAKQGRCAENQNPCSMFDMEGRAKWEAWFKASDEVPSKGAAMEQYVEVLASRWPQWESDSSETAPGAPVAKKPAQGMGFSVSTMQAPVADDNIEKDLLFWICEGDAQQVKGLLKAGADINQTFEVSGEQTALHMASEAGAHELVVELLRWPAIKLHEVDEDGKTALHLAMENHHTECAQALLSHLKGEAGKAFTTPKDEDGRTPADYATSEELEQLEPFLG